MIVCTYNGALYQHGDVITIPNVNPGQASRVRQALDAGGWTVTGEVRRGNRTTFTAVCQ